MCCYFTGFRTKLYVRILVDFRNYILFVDKYRTKFLSDDWMYERAFLDIKDEPNSEWWQAMPVSSLKIREPVTVSTNTTIQAVLDIMHARGFDQIPVISEDG